MQDRAMQPETIASLHDQIVKRLRISDIAGRPIAAVYARVSDPYDKREVSIEVQLESAIPYAWEHGFRTSPDHIFVDKYTGVELTDRPDLSRMRENVRAKTYGAVVIWKLDRLGREHAHWVILFDEAEKHGAVIQSATEDLDNSPEGELLRAVRGYCAKVERIKTLERTQGAIDRIVGQGKPLCAGKARYGYRYHFDPRNKPPIRTRVVVDHEADVVRRIFRLCIEGNSCRSIAKLLNAERIPSPSQQRGRRYRDGRKTLWGRSTIEAILHDQSYIGKPMEMHKTRMTSSRVKKTGRHKAERLPRDQWATLAEPTPDIIDPETFALANGGIQGRSKVDARTRNKRVFRMLRGMVYCGVCGKTMTTQTVSKWTKAQGRYEFFMCMSNRSDNPLNVKCSNGRTHIAYADAEVWRQVEILLRDREGLRAKLEATLRPDPSLEADLAAHQTHIDRAEATIKRLVKRLGDEEDDVVASAVQSNIKICQSEIADHRKAVEALEARIGDRSRVAKALEMIDWIIACHVENPEPAHQAEIALGMEPGLLLKIGQHMRQTLSPSDPSPEQKRQILEALGCRVYLTRTNVRVELAIPLSGCPNSSGGMGTTRQRIVIAL